jgi:hypothetical protein
LHLVLGEVSRPQLGNVGENQRPNTIQAYLNHAKNLATFLSVIGDFESLLILSDLRPVNNCPSIRADSVTKYVKYNSKANAGEILKFNGVAVLDQGGREIVCRGISVILFK